MTYKKTYICTHPLEKHIWATDAFFANKPNEKKVVGEWTMWWSIEVPPVVGACLWYLSSFKWYVESPAFANLPDCTFSSSEELSYTTEDKIPAGFPKDTWKRWWADLQAADRVLKKEHKKEMARKRKETLLHAAKEQGVSIDELKTQLKSKRDEKNAENCAAKTARHVERLMRFSTELKKLNDEINHLTKKLSDDPENFKLPGNIESFVTRAYALRRALRRCK